MHPARPLMTPTSQEMPERDRAVTDVFTRRNGRTVPADTVLAALATLAEYTGSGGLVVLCGAKTVFWPDMEACDAECILPKGHAPEDLHVDETLGVWREGDLLTYRPEETP